MKDQLIKYVDLLFAGAPNAYDIKQEILQNTLDRYDDLVAQGKSPQAAYSLAISGIGDINEILGSEPAPIHTMSGTGATEKSSDVRGDKKLMRAVAIGMYICCVVPVIALGGIGDGTLGVCMMFVMIAAATVLIILSGGGKDSQREEVRENEPKGELHKAIKTVSGFVTLGIYLAVSFITGAWWITWLIFPISGAIEGLMKAIIDLKEANQREN